MISSINPHIGNDQQIMKHNIKHCYASLNNCGTTKVNQSLDRYKSLLIINCILHGSFQNCQQPLQHDTCKNKNCCMHSCNSTPHGHSNNQQQQLEQYGVEYDITLSVTPYVCNNRRLLQHNVSHLLVVPPSSIGGTTNHDELS